jgi:hypothetical protein
LLFEEPEQEEMLAVLREHTASGTPLGTDDFQAQIASTLSLKVGKAHRGRPRRVKEGVEGLEKGL